MSRKIWQREVRFLSVTCYLRPEFKTHTHTYTQTHTHRNTHTKTNTKKAQTNTHTNTHTHTNKHTETNTLTHTHTHTHSPLNFISGFINYRYSIIKIGRAKSNTTCRHVIVKKPNSHSVL